METYSARRFENFNELLDSKYETAMLLLKELGLTRKDIGKEPWMDDELRVFFSPTHYALYELTDGLYSECDLNRSYGIYPNPFDYMKTSLEYATIAYAVYFQTATWLLQFMDGKYDKL